jgi:hypothetical protein
MRVAEQKTRQVVEVRTIGEKCGQSEPPQAGVSTIAVRRDTNCAPNERMGDGKWHKISGLPLLALRPGIMTPRRRQLQRIPPAE